MEVYILKLLDFHEKKSRGTQHFPLEFYHILTSHPRYIMSHHWHMEHEFIRILKGSMDFIMDDKKITVHSGDILYLQGGVVHSGVPNDCIYECIVFDMNELFRNTKPCHSYLQSILNHIIILKQHYSHKEHPKIHEIINGLFDCVRVKSIGYELTALGYIHRFFGYTLEHHYYSKSSDVSERNTKRILQFKKALSVIENSYQNPITLQELADAAEMNSKYFCRFFQEMTNRSPIDYLNYYRIEIASFQLITSNTSITEIAFNCGFNDLSYFIKTFKKYKGITPKKFLSSPL